MRWHDLLFAHWPLDPDAVRPLIPSALELDTYEDRAWIGVVPFRMSGVRPYGAPEPLSAAMPEINVRTYVRIGDRGGVWFFSLDTPSWPAVVGARLLYRLPYFRARIDVRGAVAPEGGEGEIFYRSFRAHPGAPAAEFEATYAPTGPAGEARPGSLEDWLTARYRLYAADRRGRVRYGDIDHPPWPLQPARAELHWNTMADPLGIVLPEDPPLLHFARELAVDAWAPRRP